MKRALRAMGLILLAAGLGLACSAANLNTGWLVPSGQVGITKADFNNSASKLVALTFDDGPDEYGYTLQISDVLAQYGVPATFFLIGQRARTNPGQVKELIARGHEIGNHSMTHPQMPKLGASSQQQEVTRCQDVLTGLGADVRWFRPPYGEYNSTTLKAAGTHGLETVLWTCDPLDWTQPGVERIAHRVIRDATPSGVILLHSTNPQTVAALPAIIDQLAAKGYRFVTMSQWQAALAGKPFEAAGARGQDAYTPYSETADVPRVVEQLEALSSEDHAHLLWSAVHSLGQETLSGRAAIHWAKLNEPASGSASHYTVYSNFESAGQLASVYRQGGSKRFHAFADPPPVEKHEAPATRLLAWDAPETVSDAPVSRGAEISPLAASEVQIVRENIPQQASTAEPAPEQDTPAPAQAEHAAGQPAPPHPVLPQLPSETIRLHARPAAEDNWQPPAHIDTSGFANRATYTDGDGWFPPASVYYLAIDGGLGTTALDGLEHLARLARLDGIVLASEYVDHTPALPGSLPAVHHSMRNLDRGAVIDMTVASCADVLAALADGKQSVFVVVRPSSLPGFSSADSWTGLSAGMQDLVLVRQLTSGLRLREQPRAAGTWQLPDGVLLLEFTGADGRSVLVLYSTLRDAVDVSIPAEFQHYSRAQLSDDGALTVAPLAVDSVPVSRRPAVLAYGPAGGVAMLSLHFLGSRDARTNLDYEQALFNRLRTCPRPAMLFYVNRPCIVLGCSNREGEWVDMRRAQAAGVPVLRRFSGGGTVYHDEHVFNYSFILPKNIVDALCGCGPGKPAGPQRYIDFFRGIIVVALSASGGGFSSGGISDIMLGGRKISGNAQRIAKEVVLHHGTIMQRCPLAAIEQLLPVPPNRTGVAHRGFVTGLAEEGRPLSRGWLAAALAGQLRAALGTRQTSLPS